MRTDPKLEEIGNKDESYKKNNTEKNPHLGLYVVWHFGDKVNFIFQFELKVMVVLPWSI